MAAKVLIVALRKKHPKLKVLAISGAIDDIILQSARALGAAGVLRKPFTMDELGTAVQEILDDSKACPV